MQNIVVSVKMTTGLKALIDSVALESGQTRNRWIVNTLTSQAQLDQKGVSRVKSESSTL